MTVSKAKQMAVNKYIKNHYDRFSMHFLNKGDKEKYKAFANKHGMSLNSFIIELLRKAYEKEN